MRVDSIRRIVLLLPLLAIGCVSQPDRESMAREYYNLGNGYYAIREYERAIEYYTLAVSRDPELLLAHYNLSLALIKQGRGEEAEQALLTLLEMDPENVSVLQLLGYAYYRDGRMKEAVEILEEALAISPENTDVLYNLGIVSWSSGDPQAAGAAFQELLPLLDEGGDAYADALYSYAKLLLEMEDHSRAADQLERYLVWNEEDAEALRLLVGAYVKLLRFDRALEAADRVLARDAGLADMWLTKAEILLTRIEDPVEGLAALNRALENGLNDEQRLRSLLDDPGLTERAEVEALLLKYGMEL